MALVSPDLEIPLVDLKAQFKTIEVEIREAIDKVLSSQAFIKTKEVSLFEDEFAQFCSLDRKGSQTKKVYCASCGNGTDALEIALQTVGVQAGDEVVTVSHTFFATVEAIYNVGAQPVFVDIDPRTCLMDASQVESLITPKTKAIVAPHLYGQPCDMSAIQAVAHKYKLKVIEDAAQAHGAFWKEQRVGTWGDIASFSFFPGKNLGCYGDGGAIVSTNKELIDRSRKLANHGRAEKYTHDFIGRNSRLDALQAAVLRVKLRYLDEWNTKRAAAASLYHTYLASCEGLTLPFVEAEAQSVWHLFVVQLQNSKVRDQLIKELDTSGIKTGIHYPIPCHQQPALDQVMHANKFLIHTEGVANRILSLPLFPEIQPSEIQFISEKVKSFLI